MIVIAIVGILAAVATPQYVKYSKRAKFVGVVQETIKFKTAAEAAYQLGFDDLTKFNSGTYGIPADINSTSSNKPVNDSVHSVEMLAGTIIATGSELVDNKNYKLVATGNNSGLTWSVDGSSSCLSSGLCTKF